MGELYKKQTGFVEKTVGDEMVIVPLVGKVAQMEHVFSLNEVGAAIYNALNEAKTQEELLALILSDFDVDKETAQRDMELFLDKAVDKGIIQKL
ncbi:PqqD family protein [Carboxylicivirga taeanensis]|uniref:PqqD family protein n=1 Tax=Carboxylicivirga taeanensis TaxID=1416875 RepID=UPI003F6DE603